MVMNQFQAKPAYYVAVAMQCSQDLPLFAQGIHPRSIATNDEALEGSAGRLMIRHDGCPMSCCRNAAAGGTSSADEATLKDPLYNANASLSLVDVSAHINWMSSLLQQSPRQPLELRCRIQVVDQLGKG